MNNEQIENKIHYFYNSTARVASLLVKMIYLNRITNV